MRKILSAILIVSCLSLVAQKGYRYKIVPGTDNKYAVPYKEIKPVSYASTAALTPTQEESTYNFSQLTGDITVSTTKVFSYTTDRMTCLFTADGSDRTVTFTSNFSENGSLVVPSGGYAVIGFVFNGTNWVESFRQNATNNTIYANYIKEQTAGQGITFSNPIIRNFTSTSYTASATVTAAALAKGLLTVTSGTLTLTLPTAGQVATQLGATAGTVFDFVVQNSGTAGTVTVAVGSGIVASTFPSSNTLTLANSATTGIATFRLTFISASAATLTRIS